MNCPKQQRERKTSNKTKKNTCSFYAFVVSYG